MRKLKPVTSLTDLAPQMKPLMYAPERKTTSAMIPLFLLERTQKLRLNIMRGTPYSEVLVKLQKLFKQQQSEQGKGRKLLGFASVDSDFIWDYALSIGKGMIEVSKIVKPIFKRESSQFPPYKILKCLAIGGFSKVYLVRNTVNGKFYAAKMIKKSTSSREKAERQRASIMNQIEISRNLHYKYLMQMHHAFETSSFYCLVYDYCPGGELFHLLKSVKKFNEKDARFYVIQILKGIKHLHDQSIIYRDIKPENILLDPNGYIKIADFGLSKRINTRSKTFTYCGSAQYMAPEMILGVGHTAALDYYCIGALLYELVTGLPPFYKNNTKQTHQSIVRQAVTFPSYLPLSYEIKSLISELLIKTDGSRLGTKGGVDQIFSHPWFNQEQIQRIETGTVMAPYLPDLRKWNFDMSDLGADEHQFTTLVIAEVEAQPPRRSRKQSTASKKSLNTKTMQTSTSHRASSSPGYMSIYKSVNNSASKAQISSQTSIKKSSGHQGEQSSIRVIQKSSSSTHNIKQQPIQFRGQKNSIKLRTPKAEYHNNKLMVPSQQSISSNQNSTKTGSHRKIKRRNLVSSASQSKSESAYSAQNKIKSRYK